MSVRKNNITQRAAEAAIIGIRIAFFVFFPSIFATAFAGIKNLVTALSAAKPLEWNSFVSTMILVCVLTILAGRIFCGYACAFGSLGDLLYWCQCKVRKKRKKKPLRLPEQYGRYLRYMKYAVLAGILLLCWSGNSSLITAYSPWTAFSLLHSRNFSAVPVGAGIVLALIIVLMAVEPRAFCRFLCPMGAVFTLLPVMPWAVVHRNRENCIKGCRACSRVCPAGLEIVNETGGDPGLMGECFSCGKCMRVCPKKNIHIVKRP